MTSTSNVDLIKQAHFLTRILTMIGLWPRANEPRNVHLMRLLAWHLPSTFLYTLLMWIDVVLSTNINYTLAVMYMALTETLLCIKIYTIWKNAALVGALLHEFETTEMYALSTTQEILAWQKAQKRFGIVSTSYIVISLFASCSPFSSVIFRGYDVLPIPFWVPYNWHEPAKFWITYFYELFAMPLTALANTSLDMFFCYLIYHVSLMYRIVGMRLESLAGDDQQVQTSMVKTIKLHQQINKFSKECELIIGQPVMGQIVLSSFVIALSIAKMQNQNFADDPGFFTTLVQYTFVMSLQIFLPCFFGNLLTENSSKLLFKLYSSGWYDFSIKNRRQVLLFMLYLNQQVDLRAGNFFYIGLPIFTKVMNNAYNLLALVVNIDK